MRKIMNAAPVASPPVAEHPFCPPAGAPGRRGFGGRSGWLLGWRRRGRFDLDDGSNDRRRGLRRWGVAAGQGRRGFAYGRTPSRRFGLRRRNRFARNRGSGLRLRRFAVAVAVGTVRSDVVSLVRPVVSLRLDRRSTKIRDRVGDFLLDWRNAILGRSYPDVAFLAATASTATPATAATPSAVAVTIIGPRGGVGSLQVLIAEIGVDIAASRPFRGEALVLPGRHVGRRLIT